MSNKSTVEQPCNLALSESLPFQKICNASYSSSLESRSCAGSCAASTTSFNMGGASADLSNNRNSSGLGPSQSSNKASIDTKLVAKDPILQTLPSHPAEMSISKSSQVHSHHGRCRLNPQHHQKCQDVFVNYNKQSTITLGETGNSFKNSDSINSNCSNKLTNQELFGKHTHETEEANCPRQFDIPSNSCTTTINQNLLQKKPSSEVPFSDGSNVPCAFGSIYTIVLSHYNSEVHKSLISKRADNLLSDVNLSDWRHHLCAHALTMTPYNFGKLLLFLTFQFC